MGARALVKNGWLVAVAAGLLLSSVAEARSGYRPVTGRGLAKMGHYKVRATPTSPRLKVRDIARLGVDVYARKVRLRAGRNKGKLWTKFAFKPNKSFDAAAAAKLGLVPYARKGETRLRYTNPAPTRGKARPALYPRKRRTLGGAFAPGKGRKRVKVAFFDADSTLRVSRSGSPSADSAHDLVILPKVAKKLKALSAKGYLIAVVSNQAGVNDGYITKAIANSGLRNMCRQLSKAGVTVNYYDFAARYDGNRKPKPGMGTRLAKQVRSKYGRQIDWKASIMVGDSAYKRGKDIQPNGRDGEDFSNSDRRFADALRKKVRSPRGLKFQHPRDHFGWAKKGVRNFRTLAEVNAFLDGQR